jgi:enterochelin esterase-like enzyme
MNCIKKYSRLFGWILTAFCSIGFVKTVFATSPLPIPFHLSKIAWDIPLASCPKGKTASYRFKSRLLKNKRELWVYVPNSYRSENPPYPLLIVFDGQAYTSQLIPGPTILDRLIAEGQIPPLIAVFVSSMGQNERNRELPCYAPFIESLTKELLPWLQQHYHITSDPSQTIVAGSSYGGLAAAYAALRYPQRYGNVLSQSGAFWWQPSDIPGAWLVDQFNSQPRLPVRFYLDVGDQETDAGGGKMSMLSVNRLFRDLLLHKGNEVAYYEFKGGHEYECWRKTFAIGLMALCKKWR